jgi:hypothetical protein
MFENQMIDAETAIAALIGTADNLRIAHNQVVADWSPDAPPLTLVFSILGRRLCSHAEATSEQEWKQVFTIVDQLIKVGDESVKDAVTTGMLEAMLAEASAGRCDFSRFARYLGAETKAYCRAWECFTGNRTPGLLE